MTQFLRRQAVRIVVGAILVAVLYVALEVFSTIRREQQLIQKLSGRQYGVMNIAPASIPEWISRPLCRRIVDITYSDDVIPSEVLSEISRLPCLHDLDLARTQITDADLEVLQRLKSLRHLHLSGTRTTPEGRAILRKMLPDCWITPEP
jgi:Leucine-rich repeat (LRR) protein